jgi:hypothetical protein
VANIKSAKKEGEELEKRFKTRFSAVAKSHSLEDTDGSLWGSFHGDFLMPLLSEMGARVYEFISGERRALDDARAYREFLSQFSEPVKDKLRAALAEVFDPLDPDVRSYILRNLHARLLIDASSLKEESLQTLASRVKGGIELFAFADTNFLFSVLGLHDNPANEAVVALFDLIQKLKGKIAIKFYVLPPTIDELRKTLIVYQRKLSSIRSSSPMAVALRDRGDLSGIALKFFEEAKTAGGKITAEDYFEPYITNPITILRSKGLELFNADLSALRTDGEVVEDLLNRLEYEKNRYGPRAKEYEAAEHDISLWHFVKRQRPLVFDSPLDARYWIVTLDLRLLGFDSYKNRRHESVAVCVHPTTLLEMLQFWLPRTEEFELALFNSLRHMLPTRFDPAAEQVTLRILRALSRFEGGSDLDEATIAAVLMNQAIRKRLAIELDDQKEIQLIKEALITETEALRNKLKRETEEKAKLATSLSSRQTRIDELTQRLDVLREKEQEITSLKDELQGAKERGDFLETRIQVV